MIDNISLLELPLTEPFTYDLHRFGNVQQLILYYLLFIGHMVDFELVISETYRIMWLLYSFMLNFQHKLSMLLPLDSMVILS